MLDVGILACKLTGKAEVFLSHELINKNYQIAVIELKVRDFLPRKQLRRKYTSVRFKKEPPFKITVLFYTTSRPIFLQLAVNQYKISFSLTKAYQIFRLKN